MMDVTVVKGAHIDTEVLERRYLSSDDLIQQSHIRRAMKGDKEVLAFIAKRISVLLNDLLRMERALSGPSEKAIALGQVAAYLRIPLRLNGGRRLEVRIQPTGLRKIFRISDRREA
jgi:hypothetical protein